MLDPEPHPIPNLSPTAEESETPESDAAPTAEPTANEAAPEAVQEADDAGDEDARSEDESETPSSDRAVRRRERREREESERKAAVEQAVTQALADREARQQAEAALAARNAEDQRVMARAAELMGTAEEENTLIDAVANGDFEAADKLKALRARKADSAVIVQAAERMAWAKVFEQIQAARKIEGVDGVFMDKVGSLPEIFTHIADATARRVEAEWSAKLERQKADYESRLGRAASQLPTTETGGRAVGAGARAFTRDEIARMDTATYKKFKSAIYEQEARGLIA